MTDGSYSVNPEEHVIDVLDELGVAVTEDQEEEIGRKLMSELAYEVFPQIPVAGDSFRYLGTEMSVLLMRQNRILRMKVRRLTEEELEADARQVLVEKDGETGTEEPDSTGNGGNGHSGEGRSAAGARALQEGQAYAVRQAAGKHYARHERKEPVRHRDHGSALKGQTSVSRGGKQKARQPLSRRDREDSRQEVADHG